MLTRTAGLELARHNILVVGIGPSGDADQPQHDERSTLFYAGHGVAIDGVNYLVPSDVPAVTPGAEARVRGASISEPDIIAELRRKGVRLALIVIDACRDNPFPRSGTRAIARTADVFCSGEGQEFSRHTHAFGARMDRSELAVSCLP